MLERGCGTGALGGLLLCATFLGSSFRDAVHESIKALNMMRDLANVMTEAAHERRSFNGMYVGAVGSGRVVIQEPKAEDWSPVAQVLGQPPVVAGRSYVFVTHHKTGTNLMRQICNLMAMLVTDGRDQCATCFRLQPPKVEGARPSCLPNPIASFGPLRGTFSRFTLISSMSTPELQYLTDHAPDFRMVHMIRDPVKVALSDYTYNTFLASDEGKDGAWDADAFFPGDNLTENLQIVANASLWYVRDIAELDAAARDDPRVLTLDLETFYADYDGTARRLFNHMFDDPPVDRLSELLDKASLHDIGRRTEAQKDIVNKTEVKESWDELVKAQDPKVMDIVRYAKPLGYGSDGTRRLPA